MKRKLFTNIIALFSIAIFAAVAANAQSPAFIYQGKLTDGAAAANGTYQFEFKLYDAASGGGQIGNTISNLPATVTNGIFSVTLDFGVNSYTGAARFLEIGARLDPAQGYTVLNPRQPIASTPYAVRAINSASAGLATNSQKLGGVDANQFVLTTDPRLNQSPGGNFIQNSTVQQPTSSFNISGEGKADKFTAGTAFNIGANRVLASSNANVFVGFGAGNAGASGGLNTFVGNNAGMNTGNATRNSFFGAGAGIQNTIGNDNSFFGSGSGLSNQSGDNNSFFGSNAGNTNTADNNSFFGANAGKVNTSGGNNSFFGFESGLSNQIGADNSFFGTGAGKANLTGTKNSFFGRNAGVANTDGDFNSFFGNGSGQANTSGIGNSFFGDSTGLLNKTGGNNAFFGKAAGLVNDSGGNNVFIGFSSGINNTTGSNNTLLGANAQVSGNNRQFATAIGAGAIADTDNRIVLGRSSDEVKVAGDFLVSGTSFTADVQVLGELRVPFVAGGSTSVCRIPGEGVFSILRACSSSIAYKNNVQNFTRGLDLIMNLRPVTFNWKETGTPDVGFIAEEVKEAEPLLATFNGKGEIEGVKYAQVTTALVNAVKEQQTQIEQQQQQIKQQQLVIDGLKKFICSQDSQAGICKQNIKN